MTPDTLSCNSGEHGINTLIDQPTYDLLLRRATSILRRETRDFLFEPADLVHEGFLRIAHSAVPVRFQGPAHLLALTTIVMRRVIIDQTRSAKSRGRLRSVPLESETLATAPAADTEIVRDALARLADYEDRLFRIVEMRFFGGFDIQEIASELDVSSRTVKRHWSAARDHLQALLTA